MATLRKAHPATLASSHRDAMAETDGTTLLAFTLRELETCWSWRVFDIGGEIVADGEAPTKDAARDAVAAAYTANDAPVPAREERDLW
jgi:phenylalanyl-tRNA synthetase beta subunit